MPAQYKTQTSHALRSTLQSAVVFVRSVETNRAMGAISLKHLVREQMQFLGGDPAKRDARGITKRTIVDSKGADLGGRISKWDSLDNLLKSVTAIHAAVKDAGSDPDKLRRLGLYETEPTTDGTTV